MSELEEERQELTQEVETPDSDSETQSLEEKRWTYQQKRADKAESELKKMQDAILAQQQEAENYKMELARLTQPKQEENVLKPPTPPDDPYDFEKVHKYNLEMTNYQKKVLEEERQDIMKAKEEVMNFHNQSIQEKQKTQQRNEVFTMLMDNGKTKKEAEFIIDRLIENPNKLTFEDYAVMGSSLYKMNYEEKSELPDTPFSATGGVNEKFTTRKKTTAGNPYELMNKLRPKK